MSEAYITYLEGVKNPRVALLNIGNESNKGNELVIDTYKLLDSKLNNFIGYRIWLFVSFQEKHIYFMIFLFFTLLS